tara:strand:- start:401 stop:835 length:435 start_codon:yes stop_codon:yes gene_type:complete
MQDYRSKTTLPYTPEQLFDIVIDVESYPEFLPWCLSSKVINRTDKYNFVANLNVGYKALDEQYTSRIKSKFASEINSIAISGPFKKLDSTWNFKGLHNSSCEVSFSIEYEFKSFFLDKLMGSLFKKATIKMLDAFESRANDLYD